MVPGLCVAAALDVEDLSTVTSSSCSQVVAKGMVPLGALYDAAPCNMKP